MCRSCSVFADVQGPGFQFESHGPPSSTSAFAWGAVKDVHLAVDEILKSWSVTACGKAFLALTDLINLENHIYAKEKAHQEQLLQEEIQLRSPEIQQKEEKSSLPAIPYPLEIYSPAPSLSSSSLSVSSLSRSGARHQKSIEPNRTCETPRTKGFDGSNNINQLTSSFDDSSWEQSLSSIIHSLFSENDRKIKSDQRISTDIRDCETRRLFSSAPLDNQLCAFDEVPMPPTHHLSIFGLSAQKGCYADYRRGKETASRSNHDNSHYNHARSVDDSTGVDEPFDNLLTKLIEQSTTTSSSSSTISFTRGATPPHDAFAVSSEFRRSFMFSESLSPCQDLIPEKKIDVSLELSSESRQIASTTLMTPDQISHLQFEEQPFVQPGFVELASTLVDSYDFTVFKRHILFDYMKHLEGRRYVASRDKMKISITSSCGPTAPQEISRSPPRRQQYPSFRRASQSVMLDNIKRYLKRYSRRDLLLNLSNVTYRTINHENCIVVENGELLVRLPIKMSRDFIGWKATPPLLNRQRTTPQSHSTVEVVPKVKEVASGCCCPAVVVQHSSSPHDAPRRKRVVSDETITIARMSRREVLNEILLKCGSCNMKELDIILSSFVACHSQILTTPQLRQLLHVIGTVPKHHLFNWISGQAELPTRRLVPLSFFSRKKKEITTGTTATSLHHNTTATTQADDQHRLEFLFSERRRSLPHNGSCNYMRSFESANQWRDGFIAGQLLLAYVNCNHPLLRRFRSAETMM